jgi:limonene-1,2-epoxide hydrolase
MTMDAVDAAHWTSWASSAVGTLTMAPGASDAAWAALFAPGGTYEDPVTARTEDVASVYALTRATFADWSMAVESAAGDARGGAIEWISQGHLSNGLAVSLHGCSVLHLSADGLVVRWRDYFDMGELARQASPPAH